MKASQIVLTIFIVLGIFQALTMMPTVGQPAMFKPKEAPQYFPNHTDITNAKGFEHALSYQGWFVEQGKFGYEYVIMPFVICVVFGLLIYAICEYATTDKKSRNI